MSLPTNIDTMKSMITKKGGMARANRFAIYMTHPSTTMDSLLNFNKENLITNLFTGGSMGGFFNDPRDMFLLCESVQIPGKRIMTMEQPTSHFTAKKPYSMLTEEISFVFHLTNDYYVRKYFDEWQHMIVDSRDFQTHYKKHYCKDIILQQLTPSNDIIPAYSMRLQDAYPIATSPIDLNNATENANMSMTVTMGYTTWFDLTLQDGFAELGKKFNEVIGETQNALGI
tara:strand:+ start:1614 stop:2297 length:684 start_codon:yes stop_codon:yes gene_type:complete